jgi:HK97 family phage major capsid protein
VTVDEMLAEQDAIMAAPAEDGDLSDEQVTRYEELDGLIQRGRGREEIERRHSAARAAVTPPIRTTTTEVRESDDTVTRAWDTYMRTGHRQHIDNLAPQLRAQSEMVGSEGGYTVPETFRNKIVERLKAFGGLANVVENYVTASGEPVRWATVDDTANMGEIVPENNAPTTGADIVFGEANLGAYKYMAVGAGGLPLRLSVELVQDSAFDIEAKVSQWLGRRMMRQLAIDIVSGSGAGEPLGIITGKTGVQTAANNALTYADLLHYVHSIDPDYRASGACRWAFNDAALETIQGLKDTNGRPLLVDSAQGIENAPGGLRLLGYPVTIDQAFPAFTNNSPTVNWGVFGDLTEAYVLRRVRDVVIVVDPYTRSVNGQIQYTAWMRADGTVQNPNAYVALTGKT